MAIQHWMKTWQSGEQIYHNVAPLLLSQMQSGIDETKRVEQLAYNPKAKLRTIDNVQHRIKPKIGS